MPRLTPVESGVYYLLRGRRSIVADPRKHELREGDVLYVKNADGTSWRFTVNHSGFDPTKQKDLTHAKLTLLGSAELVPDQAEESKQAFEKGSGGLRLSE